MENAVASIGHEIEHTKQMIRGSLELSEKEAEEAGLRYLETFQRRMKYK